MRWLLSASVMSAMSLHSPQEAQYESTEYFNKAFQGNFQEGQDGIMHLPEDSPNALRYTPNGFTDQAYRTAIPEATPMLFTTFIFLARRSASKRQFCKTRCWTKSGTYPPRSTFSRTPSLFAKSSRIRLRAHNLSIYCLDMTAHTPRHVGIAVANTSHLVTRNREAGG
jgi:hypothetical protein